MNQALDIIEKRLNDLSNKRRVAVDKKDFVASNQLWARIKELESLKIKLIAIN